MTLYDCLDGVLHYFPWNSMTYVFPWDIITFMTFYDILLCYMTFHECLTGVFYSIL